MQGANCKLPCAETAPLGDALGATPPFGVPLGVPRAEGTMARLGLADVDGCGGVRAELATGDCDGDARITFVELRVLN